MSTLLKLFGFFGLLRSSVFLWGAYYDRPHRSLVIGHILPPSARRDTETTRAPAWYLYVGTICLCVSLASWKARARGGAIQKNQKKEKIYVF